MAQNDTVYSQETSNYAWVNWVVTRIWQVKNHKSLNIKIRVWSLLWEELVPLMSFHKQKHLHSQHLEEFPPAVDATNMVTQRESDKLWSTGS